MGRGGGALRKLTGRGPQRDVMGSGRGGRAVEIVRDRWMHTFN